MPSIPKRRSATLIFATLFATTCLAAGTVEAMESARWRTAGGGLYFGSNPPAGSVPAVDLDKPKAVPAPAVSKPVAAPRQSAPPARASVNEDPVLPDPASGSLMQCVRNPGAESRRAWVVDGDRRFLVGVVEPGRVSCLSINVPAGERSFRIESEPIAARY